MPVPIDVITALNALKKPDKVEDIEIPEYLKDNHKKSRIYQSLAKRKTNEEKLIFVKEHPEMHLALL